MRTVCPRELPDRRVLSTCPHSVLHVADSVEADAEAEEAEISNHHIITARIVGAHVRETHWNGKHFAPVGDAPPCLSFLGSQAFAGISPLS